MSGSEDALKMPIIRIDSKEVRRIFELPDATVNVLQGILFIAILLSETLYGRRRTLRAKAVAA